MSKVDERDRIDSLVNEYQSLQQALKQHQLSKQQLMSQSNENETVLKELSILEADAVLYKLVGPVLVKQSVDDAKRTVQKRLSYIETEMGRCENLISETATKIESATKQLEAFQRQFLAHMQQQGNATAPLSKA